MLGFLKHLIVFLECGLVYLFYAIFFEIFDFVNHFVVNVLGCFQIIFRWIGIYLKNLRIGSGFKEVAGSVICIKLVLSIVSLLR
jgi:hypothetical protein